MSCAVADAATAVSVMTKVGATALPNTPPDTIVTDVIDPLVTPGVNMGVCTMLTDAATVAVITGKLL